MTEKMLTVFKRDAIPIAYSEPEKRGTYEELLLKLKEVQEKHDAANSSDLGEAIDALSVVIAFLNANLDVLENRLTLPLGGLLRALVDASNGGKPPMLYDVKHEGGRPIREDEAAERAQCLIMYQELCEAGVENSAEYLAGELKAAGIEDTSEKKKPEVESKPITAEKLESWRSDFFHNESIKGLNEAYVYLRARMKERERSMSPDQAKSFVKGLIFSLHINSF
jgi:hypothetical protein